MSAANARPNAASAATAVPCAVPANLQFPVRLGDQQREPFGGRASCGQHGSLSPASASQAATASVRATEAQAQASQTMAQATSESASGGSGVTRPAAPRSLRRPHNRRLRLKARPLPRVRRWRLAAPHRSHPRPPVHKPQPGVQSNSAQAVSGQSMASATSQSMAQAASGRVVLRAMDRPPVPQLKAVRPPPRVRLQRYPGRAVPVPRWRLRLPAAAGLRQQVCSASAQAVASGALSGASSQSLAQAAVGARVRRNSPNGATSSQAVVRHGIEQFGFVVDQRFGQW